MGCLSKISWGKRKQMLDALVRDVPLGGKRGSLLTREGHFQCSTGLLFFISQLRGKGKREIL